MMVNTGLLADAKMSDLLNYGLSAAGLVPFVPAVSAAKQTVDAFHGSPYDFTEFDMSRIGSGEGATHMVTDYIFLTQKMLLTFLV